jgi:adenylate cyclase
MADGGPQTAVSQANVMGTEIERKWLVANDDWRAGVSASFAIRQGYLVADDVRTVRVRVKGAHAYLTIKGRPAQGSFARAEYEYEIPVADAHHMLDTLCDGRLIEKTRFLVPVDGHTFEIDVFAGAHSSLIIAELELADESQPHPHPSWLGLEVTHDRRYANSTLASPTARAARATSPESR